MCVCGGVGGWVGVAGTHAKQTVEHVQAGKPETITRQGQYSSKLRLGRTFHTTQTLLGQIGIMFAAAE